jgi:hypothetical protein
MTYEDVIKMRSNLAKVNFIQNADAKFVYAVAKNLRRLDQIVKDLNKIIEPSDDIVKYREKIGKINLQYAERDSDGSVGYLSDPVYGRVYRKIVGDGNPTSDHGKAMEKLEEEYAVVIDEHKGKVKAYEAMLKEDLPEGEFRKHMIDLEIVPAGLNPEAMRGCLEFIKEPAGNVESEKKV